MGLLSLNRAENRLCRHVAHGDRVTFAKNAEKIDADVLRHIVVGLPIVKEGSEKWAGQPPADGKTAKGAPCPRTGVGIRIEGARIKGRLLLDSAVNDSGGPICPLEFRNCEFEQGISGRRSHFSRLGLVACSFGDPEPAHGAAEPTIDLSEATIIGDLDLTGIKPLTRGKHLHYLWMRAVGARIEGNLDLSRAHLRAPADIPKRLLDASRIQPLDLSLANIEGDLRFLFGKAEGTISGRGAHIRGDVWMSGTQIECRPDDKMALFFQLATIGGGLMLDGRWELADQEKASSNAKKNSFRSFCADGRLNLFGVRVGGSIVMKDVRIESAQDTCIDLTGARVGDRIEVGRENKDKAAYIKGRIRLDRVTVGSFVLFKHVQLGSTNWAITRHCIDARSLVAKKFIFSEIRPWVDRPSGSEWNLSITLAEASLERLRIVDGRMSGIFEASPLCCTGDVILAGTIGKKVDLENAKIGGTLDISALTIEGRNARLLLRDATIDGALRLRPRNPRSEARFGLSGTADLTGLSCNTLDDDIGRRWGEGAQVKMNHFAYRRTGGPFEPSSPPAEPPGRASIYSMAGAWLKPRRAAGRWPWRWLPESPAERSANADREGLRKPSYRIVSDWIQSRRADGRLPWRLFPTIFLSGKRDYWEPWQQRRNWIYQQYASRETRAAAADPYVSITRHKIDEHNYHPQPFEQAIRVAHAEGREDFATQFEIHKQFLEWKQFNQRVRWGLAGIALTLAALWLVINKPTILSIAATVLAWAVTMGLIIFGSWLRGMLKARLKRRRPKLSEAELRTKSKHRTWVLYGLSAALLLPLWLPSPFHYFVALVIFLTIRWMAILAHGVMRFGFGYLRRPLFATVTFILAFLVGWLGVHVANSGGMIVIAAKPIANIAVPVPPPTREAAAGPLLMGSPSSSSGRGIVRELPCSPEFSEPLYALDVLLPLVDLREEDRCEIRRMREHDLGLPPPGRMTPGQLWDYWWEVSFGNPRFWWMLKAIYAIAGWFIVSLSILTFAQVNKVHAEPPHEHK